MSRYNGPLSVLARWVLIGVVALSVASCSSSSSDDDSAASTTSTASAEGAEGAGTPTGTASTSADGTSSTSNPSATGSSAVPTGDSKKAVCARAIKIVEDFSRQAIATLTPALQTGDQAKVTQAQDKAHAYYREAAVKLRAEAKTTTDATLQKQIRAAANYFDKAARSSTQGTDNTLATLSSTCA